MRSEVQSLAERLDEEQWTMQERADAGEVASAEHLAAFSRARASSTDYYVLDADPLTAALEALYETNAAVDDLPALRDLVARQLNS